MDDIDRDWLQQVLRAAGYDVTVASCIKSRIRRSGSSQAFCQVTYGGDGNHLLAERLCIKSCIEEDSASLAALGIFEAEVSFYEHIDATIDLRTPKVYAIVWDEERRINTLVMEDLNIHGARFGDIEGSLLTEAEARSMVKGLAELHSRHWNAALSNAPGVKDLDTGYASGNWMYDLYSRFDRQYLTEMLAKPRTRNYPPKIRDADRLWTAFWNMAAGSDKGELCVIHGDPHIGNIFVVDGEAGLCDWQCIRRGRWEHDVAYMICSSLPIDVRRRIDKDLVRAYCAKMAERGVEIAFEEAWDRYRRGIMYGLFGWTTSEDHYHYAEDAIGRYASAFSAAASDHGTIEMLTS
jgi:hypothetical protein